MCALVYTRDYWNTCSGVADGSDCHRTELLKPLPIVLCNHYRCVLEYIWKWQRASYMKQLGWTHAISDVSSTALRNIRNVSRRHYSNRVKVQKRDSYKDIESTWVQLFRNTSCVEEETRGVKEVRQQNEQMPRIVNGCPRAVFKEQVYSHHHRSHR